MPVPSYNLSLRDVLNLLAGDIDYLMSPQVRTFVNDYELRTIRPEVCVTLYSVVMHAHLSR